VFYCGFLPSFWVQLRNIAIPAVHTSTLATTWPTLVSGVRQAGLRPGRAGRARECRADGRCPVPFPQLGGPTHVTVGLVATLTTVLAIIAADSGAYLVGRAIGRTQLTPVSPKKTVEGALGGMASAAAAVVGMCKLTGWPAVWWGAPLLGVTVFCTSLFGDLIESSMKRDAGLKDSGNVIPGHGGVLDRFDSYIFTGPIVYFIVKYCFGSMWGV